MILAIECAAACMLFSAIIVGSVLKDRESWLHEYAPAVQQRFLECNPDFTPRKVNSNTAAFVAAKLGMCVLFTAVLTLMAYFAGARNFITGAVYSYVIWSVVNIFDAVVLDILVFAKWKRIRLKGTENMDAEYASNWRRSLLDGVYGILIGLPVACACGGLVELIQFLWV